MRPARIGFDVAALVRPFSSGVRRAVHGTLDALESRGNVEVVRLEPPAGAHLSRWRQRDLPARERREELLGIHSFTSAFPLRGRGRRVQTIHELPWRHGVRENAGLRHRAWARFGPLRAWRVVCPTEHVACDVGRRTKLRVVPWGVGEPFVEEPPPHVIDEVVLERLRLGSDPIVLSPGGVRAKKNLAALLRGLAERHCRGQRPLQLVVTGEHTADLRRDLGLASQLGLARWVSTPGPLEDEELAALLRLAVVVPVLSHSEGFGLPVLEALASGTPVLVPPRSAQAEVAGQVAIVVDPADPASVADGLERAAAERELLRPALVERAAGFSWQASARAIEELWAEAR